MTMTPRTFFKYTAKTLVLFAADHLIEKILVTNVPVSRKFKGAQIAGAIGGWYISEKLESRTDRMVDFVIDHYLTK